MSFILARTDKAVHPYHSNFFNLLCKALLLPPSGVCGGIAVGGQVRTNPNSFALPSKASTAWSLLHTFPASPHGLLAHPSLWSSQSGMSLARAAAKLLLKMPSPQNQYQILPYFKVQVKSLRVFKFPQPNSSSLSPIFS